MQNQSGTQDRANTEAPDIPAGGQSFTSGAASETAIPEMSAASSPHHMRIAEVPASPQPTAPRLVQPRGKGGPGPFRRRIDRLILQYCATAPTRLSGLTREIAKGTLYRHVTKLVDSGALKRYGREYQTNTEGQRWLLEERSGIDWNIFDRLYPPFTSVPTPYHKALLELILAAVVVRTAARRDDHLCAFAAMGGTLRWKTSCARMACTMLGIDPSVGLLNLSSETGKSIFARRTHDGHLLSQRSVLSSPLAVFDDFLQASDALRVAIGPFLSGRRTIPYENGVIAVECTTLLTMNPRAKLTLEEQTGLTPAQLRRLIVCDLNAVVMPDLSLTGHLALDAALKQGPLPLPTLRTELCEHRRAVVQLVREVVRPEMHERIDTEMLLILAAGMTGFIDDEERAVQQTLYDVGLMLETLGWTTSDWLTAVSHFSLLGIRHVPVELPHPQTKGPSDTPDVNDVILIRRHIMEPSKSDNASYALSEESRARLILLAAEEQISFAHAVDVVTEYYDSSVKSLGCDLHDLHSILALSKDLKLRELPVKHVKVTLEFIAYLQSHKLGIADFAPAIVLLKLLQQFGLTTHAPELTRILDVACTLVTSGVSPIAVEQWLGQRTKHHEDE